MNPEPSAKKPRSKKPKAVPFEVDVKRFPFSDKIRYTCPKCGKKRTLNGLMYDYLSYPTANKEFDLGCYCHECDHEWNVKAILHIRLEVLSAR